MNLVEAALERRRREQTNMSLVEILADDVAHEPMKERAGSPAQELTADHYAWSQPR